MIDFVQKQLEASERLFEMMRQDHKERMKEIETWAEASQNLMKKLDERDRLIAILREDKRHEPRPMAEESDDTLSLRVRMLELQLEHVRRDNKEMAEANAKLMDEVQKLSLDLGLREAAK